MDRPDESLGLVALQKIGYIKYGPVWLDPFFTLGPMDRAGLIQPIHFVIPTND